MTDKTAEQLRACPFCGASAFVQCNFGREWWVQCENDHIDGHIHASEPLAIHAWNTRADSGEAVACRYRYHGSDGLIGNWTTGDLEDADSLRVDSRFEIEPLFTHPRPTAVDARYVTVKHPRFFNEEENNAWHRAFPDLMAAFDAIAAIASREGE